MDIVSRGNILKIVRQKRKTQAAVLKDWRVGDEIQMSVNAACAGASRGRTYSTDIKVTNVSRNTEKLLTFNQMGMLYEIFELKESEE